MPVMAGVKPHKLSLYVRPAPAHFLQDVPTVRAQQDVHSAERSVLVLLRRCTSSSRHAATLNIQLWTYRYLVQRRYLSGK